MNDALSVSGFASGSYLLDQPNPGSSTDHFGLDNALLAVRGKSGPAGFVVSIYHEPDTPQETTLLDAAVNFETAGGVTITGGRIQSILAYEAYFSVDNPNSSFANNELLTIAPGYHSGIKAEYGTKTWSGGIAVLDSVYSGANYLKGDGEIKQNQGFEAVLSFKGVKDLVITVDAGYEGDTATTHQAAIGDIWATYQLSPDTKLAADWARKDGGSGDRGHNWIALVDHQFDDRHSAAFRVSGESLEGGGRFIRYTITPALKLTPSLTLRAEYSHTNYQNNPVGSATSVGVQAFVKF